MLWQEKDLLEVLTFDSSFVLTGGIGMVLDKSETKSNVFLFCFLVSLDGLASL